MLAIVSRTRRGLLVDRTYKDWIGGRNHEITVVGLTTRMVPRKKYQKEVPGTMSFSVKTYNRVYTDCRHRRDKSVLLLTAELHLYDKRLTSTRDISAIISTVS